MSKVKCAALAGLSGFIASCASFFVAYSLFEATAWGCNMTGLTVGGIVFSIVCTACGQKIIHEGSKNSDE